MEEEWKEINGYKISNYGRVINNKGYELKNTPDKSGYVVCKINLGNGIIRGMHRIVATAFIPNPENLPEVNHIDGDKSNNRVDNLEWVSRKENQYHASYVLNKRIGEDQYYHVLTEEEVLQIYDLCKYTKMLYTEIAELYGVSRTIPDKIANGRSWKHLNLKPIHKNNKPIVGSNIETGDKIYYDSVRFAVNDGFSASPISCCCKGKQRTHKGYRWEYLNN